MKISSEKSKYQNTLKLILDQFLVCSGGSSIQRSMLPIFSTIISITIEEQYLTEYTTIEPKVMLFSARLSSSNDVRRWVRGQYGWQYDVSVGYIGISEKIKILNSLIMRHYDYYFIIIFCAILWLYLLSIGEKDLSNMFFWVILSFFGVILGSKE